VVGNIKHSQIFISVVGLLASSVVCGSTFTDTASFRGFGTIAATHAGSSELGFKTDILQDGQYGGWSLNTDSVLGMQLDASLSNSFKVSAQLVAKDRRDDAIDKYIERAYVIYTANEQWSFRLGRVGNDTQMISEFGSVGFAYDWVRSPTELYGEVPLLYMDGVDATYRYFFDAGVLSSKVFLGKSDTIGIELYGENTFELSPIVQLSTRYDGNNMAFRASYTQGAISNFSNPQFALLSSQLALISQLYPSLDTHQIADQFELEGEQLGFYAIGGEYRYQDWKFTNEMSYLESDTNFILPYFSTYISVLRRFNEVSLYTIGSFGKSLKSTYQVAAGFPAEIQSVFDLSDIDQKTLSLGMRWDFYNNLAFKTQWDRTWIGEDKVFLWGTATNTSTAQSIDTVTFSLNFIF
jgi:hypothetical protein